jgi:hypothetical protein
VNLLNISFPIALLIVICLLYSLFLFPLFIRKNYSEVMSNPPVASSDYCDLIIVNGTDRPLTLTDQRIHELGQGLKFPSTIDAFTSVTVSVECAGASSQLPPPGREKGEDMFGDVHPDKRSSSSSVSSTSSSLAGEAFAEFRYVLSSPHSAESKAMLEEKGDDSLVSVVFLITNHNIKVTSRTTTTQREYCDNLGWSSSTVNSTLEFIVSGVYPHYSINNR